MQDWLIVIPARLQSSRLPEKPLADICGKPMIVRVYENLSQLLNAGATAIVATDSEKIREVCLKNNVPVEMTSPDHTSGTDRCYEVAQKYDKQLILNVQGDEPFADTDTLLNLCNKLASTPWADIGTVVHKVENGKGYHDPNVVKAVLTAEGKALYFSRSPVPYCRDEPSKEHPYYHHQGIYAFRRPALQQFVGLGKSGLEENEKLEQLRALEHGMSILCVLSDKKAHGVDTPEDLEEAREIFQKSI